MLGSFVQNIYKFVSLPKSKRGTAYYSRICFTHKSKLKFIQAPLEIQKFYHILTFLAAVKYICMKLKSYLELHVADWYKIENFTFWSLFCPISAVVTWHIDTTWSLLTVESATMNNFCIIKIKMCKAIPYDFEKNSCYTEYRMIHESTMLLEGQ